MVAKSDAGQARRRRRLTTAVKESLRDLRVQLALLNHRVGARVDLKDVDLDCLDLVNRHGPLSPSALAQQAGLHPATMTGILDRLERGGWVVRERDRADRRAVVVRPLRERNGELLRQYAGMNNLMDDICAGYDEAELELLAGFLRRVADAGRDATDDLAAGFDGLAEGTFSPAASLPVSDRLDAEHGDPVRGGGHRVGRGRVGEAVGHIALGRAHAAGFPPPRAAADGAPPPAPRSAVR